MFALFKMSLAAFSRDPESIRRHERHRHQQLPVPEIAGDRAEEQPTAEVPEEVASPEPKKSRYQDSKDGKEYPQCRGQHHQPDLEFHPEKWRLEKRGLLQVG